MTGRVIENDLFGIADRLREIDGGYFIFFNYKTKRFELHNKRAAPHTLCLVLPFDRLDERTVRHVRYTRAERFEQIQRDIERDNARLTARMAREAADNAVSTAEKVLSRGTT